MNENLVIKTTEQESTQIVKIPLHDDALLETIQRYDYDTPFGWMTEIHFQRKQKLDRTKLLGKRLAHLNCQVQTTQKLNHETIEVKDPVTTNK